MGFVRFIPSTLTLACLAMLAVAITGCDEDGATGPLAVTQFSDEITLGELSDMLAAGTLRLEIELRAGGPPLVASEVEVEEPEEVTEDEEVESRIVAPGFTDLNTTECSGTLALALEGVEVHFDATTRFEADDDSNGDDDLTCDEFVQRVQAAIDAGKEPKVEAERPPPTDPQAPGDPMFFATEIELEDGDEHGEIEMNTNDDNLVGCDVLSTPPAGCLGVIQVLSLSIVIDGDTELEAETENGQEEREFEGIVESVDLVARTFTLTDQTVVTIVADTEIEDGESDEHLGSLEEVQAALDATQTVEAEGEGSIDSEDPLMLTAIEVEFEIEDDDD